MNTSGKRPHFVLKTLVILHLLCSFLNSCKHKDNTHLNSLHLNYRERMRLVSQNITLFSPIQDAEFELFNVNGFKGQRIALPGPSSWNYIIAIRIDTSYISKWTSDFVETDADSLDGYFTEEIIQHRVKNWTRHSTPRYFKRKNGDRVFMKVYQKEGIIFKRIINI